MTGILVFGSTGQVSTELKAFADIVAVGRDKVDLFDPAACAAAIEAYQPNFVINAAAYTSVDGAEKEEGLANIINGDSPAAMAKVCKMLNIPFVHIYTFQICKQLLLFDIHFLLMFSKTVPKGRFTAVVNFRFTT